MKPSPSVYIRLAALATLASCSSPIPSTDDVDDDVAAAASTELELLGFGPPIRILQDSQGIPHVSASSEFAGYIGGCYAAARDRLWQMDLLRRVGRGRVAEVLGPGPNRSVVNQDLLARTLGIQAAADAQFRRAAPRTQLALIACSVGVNHYMETARATGTLPPEFGALGYEPEPWLPRDTFVVGQGVLFPLEALFWLHKVQRLVVTSVAGPEVAATLLPLLPSSPSLFDARGNLNPRDAFVDQALASAYEPTAVAPTILPRATIDPSSLTTIGLRDLLWCLPGGGSNNVAVDGRWTDTGGALHEYDPHLSVSVPSLPYFIHIETPRWNAQGAWIPGLPTFVMGGHNEHIAWSQTYGNADVNDVYLEQLRTNAAGQTEVLSAGTWIRARTRTETVAVRGEAPASLTVITTPHGPIVNGAIPSLDAIGPLAVRTGFQQPEWSYDGYFDLVEANDFASFRDPLLALPDAQFEAAGGLRAVFAHDSLAVMRQVYDLHDLDATLAVGSVGQSGHPASPHFRDHAALWRDGHYFRVPFTSRALRGH